MYIEEKQTNKVRKLHFIKIFEQYYKKILTREKTFELRKDDRGYQIGDILGFKVIDENKNELKYPSKLFEITYILKNPLNVGGLEKDYAVMSIKEYKQEFQILE